jgi:hypothetical protein
MSGREERTYLEGPSGPKEGLRDDDGERRTTTRRYLLIPQKYSASDGYQRACGPPRTQGNEKSLSDVPRSGVDQARVKAESSQRTGVGLYV